jgi:hypothetical protein
MNFLLLADQSLISIACVARIFERAGPDGSRRTYAVLYPAYGSEPLELARTHNLQSLAAVLDPVRRR